MSGVQTVFVSPEEAAIVFGTTPQTIRAWIAEGKLRTAPRVGRKHRIFVESVAEQAGLSVERVHELITSARAINKTGALMAA